MRKFLKTLVATTICLSGWALVPLTSLPTQAFGWELFAEAYGEIFSDGFETGDTSRWSTVVGQVGSTDVASADDFEMSFRIDGSSWKPKKNKLVTLATGLSDKRVPAFKVEGRRRGNLFEVRARAARKPNVWAETPWRAIDRRYGSIEIEWRRAMERTKDGLLYVSVDGDLLLWLVDLDNSTLPLRELQRDFLGSQPVASIISGTFATEDSEAGDLEAEDSEFVAEDKE